MSSTNDDTSDVKKAAEKANSQHIQQNLNEDKELTSPESLTESEQTHFIDEDVRTDK